MWWWWIASWAKDEQYKGKNNLLRRGVLVLGGCEDGLDLVQVEMAEALFVRFSCLLWWLILFIEALVLSPNIEWKGSQQRPI